MLCNLNADQYLELTRLEGQMRAAMAYRHAAWESFAVEFMRYMSREGLSPDHLLGHTVGLDFDAGCGRLLCVIMKHPRDFPRGSMGYELLKRADLLHLRESAA